MVVYANVDSCFSLAGYHQSGFHLGGGRGGGHSPPLGISLPPLGIFTFPIIQYCEKK